MKRVRYGKSKREGRDATHVRSSKVLVLSVLLESSAVGTDETLGTLDVVLGRRGRNQQRKSERREQGGEGWHVGDVDWLKGYGYLCRQTLDIRDPLYTTRESYVERQSTSFLFALCRPAMSDSLHLKSATCATSNSIAAAPRPIAT